MALAFMRLMRKRQQQHKDGRGGAAVPSGRWQDEAAWRCKECGFQAKSKAGLTAHMRVHK